MRRTSEVPAACSHGNRTLGLHPSLSQDAWIQGCELRGAAGLWNYGIAETQGLKSLWFAFGLGKRNSGIKS